MESKGIPRAMSIFILLFLVFLVFAALGWLLVMEFTSLFGSFPDVASRLSKVFPDLKRSIEESAGISVAAQNEWLKNLSASLQRNLGGLLQNIFNTTFSTILMLVLAPIYAALFLYHRGVFGRFMNLMAGPEHHEQLTQILHKSIYSYYKYVKGNFYVYCIVGALNSIVLLALGIPHAIFYGMVSSFMMVIPYIGIFISASIPVYIAFITKDSMWYPTIIVLLFVFIQYLESNVIFPRVVGDQLNLSTYATLIAAIGGAVFWGIAGMVLIVPFLAILKIVSDYVPEWKALNLLLNRDEGYDCMVKKNKLKNKR
jgi:predicted PurR-regulated permease PerM